MLVWKNLLHILLTGPLLIYIGLKKPKQDWIYNLILILGIILSIYFLILIIKIPYSPYHSWLFIHFIVFIPLLLFVGIRKTNTPNIIYSILLTLGIAAVGYHSVRLYQKIKK
jgi:hypothetical protein